MGSREQGWVAECQDCPTTVGGYGEVVKVGQEFAPNVKVDAELWAFLHRNMHHGHRVDVKWFERMGAEFYDLNPHVLRALFGDRGDQ